MDGGQVGSAAQHTVSIGLVVLYCHDPDVTATFYEQLLGLRFAHEQHGNGPAHRAAELMNGQVLELYPAKRGDVTSILRLGLRLGPTARSTAQGDRTAVDPDGRTVVVEARE